MLRRLNLSWQERGVRRCEVNNLKVMIPDLDPEPSSLPRGSLALGDDFALLTATDSVSRTVTVAEGHAIRRFILDNGGYTDCDELVHVVRWARLRLPNGQICCSRWKEDGMQTENIRMSRNVKVL